LFRNYFVECTKVIQTQLWKFLAKGSKLAESVQTIRHHLQEADDLGVIDAKEDEEHCKQSQRNAITQLMHRLWCFFRCLTEHSCHDAEIVVKPDDAVKGQQDRPSMDSSSMGLAQILSR